MGEKFIFESFACLFVFFFLMRLRLREREREREKEEKASKSKVDGYTCPLDDRIFISFCSPAESRIIGRGEQ